MPTKHLEHLGILLGECPPAVGDLPNIATDVGFNQLDLLREIKLKVVTEEELLCLLVDLFTGGWKVKRHRIFLAGTPTVIMNRSWCNDGKVVDAVSQLDW